MAADDDLIPLIEEPAAVGPVDPWRVLVVDDVEAIVQITCIVLDGQVVQGRPISTVFASSCAEGVALLASLPPGSVDLALVDMIMESEDAGLRLIRHIRGPLGDRGMRIVIRTGQPEFDEESQMSALDIDGFIAKTEMDATRLRTVVSSLLRSLHRTREQAEAMLAVERVSILAALDAGDLAAVRRLLNPASRR